MTLAHPLAVALIPVGLAAVGWMFRRARGAERLATFAHIKQLWADRDGLVESPALLRHRRRGALLAVGIIGALLALARPQWGSIEETTYDQAREVLIALDLSRSMLAEDVTPTRLARAKLLVEGLLDQLHGERVGLTVFAGTSFLQSPMSADYEVLRDFLSELEPAYLPQGGTDYQSMLTTATKAFGQEGEGDRYLVVLSDGEAHDEQWKEMIPALRAHGIRVIGLGVGTAEGAVVPDVGGGLMKDGQGAAVLSRLEPQTLQNLAAATGGTYRDAAAWVDIAELVQATVDQGQKGRYVEEQSVRLRDQYQWFLAPALLVLLLSYWLDLPVFPVARVMGHYKRASAGTALTKVAAALMLILVLANRAQAASTVSAPAFADENSSRPSRPYSGSNRPLPPSGSLAHPPSAVGPAGPAASAEATAVNPLEAVVGELAAKQDLSAADYAALADTTIALASQQGKVDGPARTGVIDDALRGVDAGEALDTKAADWPTLRQQLEALKQPKEEPKPPPQEQPKDEPHDRQQDQQNQPQNQQNQNSQSDQQQEPQKDQHGGQGQSQQDQSTQEEQGRQNAEQNQPPNQSGQGGSQAQEQPDGSGEQTSADGAPSPADKKEETKAGGEQPQEREHPGEQQSATGEGTDQSGEPKEPKALNSADAGLGEQATPPEPVAGQQEPKPQPATRMVGGGRPQDQSLDGKNLALVDAVDRMNRIKDGDAPAILFDRMNQAEGQRPPDKNGKNW